jgi:hypothetical protein
MADDTIAHHKHCVFCGESSTYSMEQRTGCKAPNNPLKQDTAGNRPHAYLEGEFPHSRVQFFKPNVSTENDR